MSEIGIMQYVVLNLVHTFRGDKVGRGERLDRKMRQTMSRSGKETG